MLVTFSLSSLLGVILATPVSNTLELEYTFNDLLDLR